MNKLIKFDTMKLLSAICALLPLAVALPTCSQEKINKFLALKPLDAGVIGNLNQNQLWTVAMAGADVDRSIVATEVTLGNVNGNTITAYYTLYRNSSGLTPLPLYAIRFTVVKTSNNREFVLTINRSVAVYLFMCSKNFIGGYRCQVSGTSGSNGKREPEYFIWATWDKKDKNDVDSELNSCLNVFKNIDSSISFSRGVHP